MMKLKMFLFAHWSKFAIALIAGWLVFQWNAGQRAIERVQELETQLEQVRENQKIQEEINQREAVRIQEMESLRERVRSLQDEARNDPDAGLPGLGVRGTQRLNAIRP